LSLIAQSKNLDPTVSGGNTYWWFGTYDTDFSAKSLYKGKTSNYFVYVNICCRINAIQGGNAGKVAIHNGWLTPSARRYSLLLKNFPRIFVFSNYNINEMFQITAINREDFFAVLRYSLAPTGSSSLPGPSGLTQDAPEAKLVINDPFSGNYSWVPTTDPGKGFLSWAFNTEVRDPQVTTGKHAIQLDFVFIVIRPCLPADTGCNHPPVWTRVTQHDVIATVPYTYTFFVKDQDNENLTIENDPPPAYMTISRVDGTSSWLEQGTTNKVASVTVVYDVEIDGPAGAAVCLSALDSRMLTSLGLFCPKFNVIKPDYMFVTGTLRVFQDTNTGNTNYFNGLKQPWPTDAKIKPKLDSTSRKIELESPGTAITTDTALTTDIFNSWWSDETLGLKTQLYSITMVNYPTLSDGYDKYDSKGAKRVYNIIRPWWHVTGATSPAQYFTYEIHTKFDLLDTETLHFGVTGGELFVFMNSTLVLSITNNVLLQSLNVTHLQQNQVSITSQQIRQAIGTYKGDGTKADTYNIDIFYTHRSVTNSGFYMQFANSTACSAISVLRDPNYADLLKSAVVFDYAPRAGPVNSTQTLWNPQQWTTSAATTVTETYMQLITSAATSTSGTAWYKDKLKILAGFEVTFTFRMSTQATGLAFVIQDHSPTARGSDGAGMGYAGLYRTIAIEFDAMANTESVDAGFNYQHISAHQPRTTAGTISAVESTDYWPSGSSPIGNLVGLPFGFNNGTAHSIRIEMNPTDSNYWVSVYVNLNVRPMLTLSFNKQQLESWFGDGAYIGFTTSNMANRAGDVTIDQFKTTIIPALAVQSYPGMFFYKIVKFCSTFCMMSFCY
jgi:hypothetical protein